MTYDIDRKEKVTTPLPALNLSTPAIYCTQSDNPQRSCHWLDLMNCPTDSLAAGPILHQCLCTIWHTPDQTEMSLIVEVQARQSSRCRVMTHVT
ncbi:hypothetical protein V6Z96_003978 [Aspergillus fumigatus]